MKSSSRAVEKVEEETKKYDQAINMYQQIIDRPGIDPIFKAGAQKEIERVKSILRQ